MQGVSVCLCGRVPCSGVIQNSLQPKKQPNFKFTKLCVGCFSLMQNKVTYSAIGRQNSQLQSHSRCFLCPSSFLS